MPDWSVELGVVFSFSGKRRIIVKVNWDEDICIHAGKCVEGLPSVFKVVDKKFVIEQSGADESAIREVVAKCPSGALTIEE